MALAKSKSLVDLTERALERVQAYRARTEDIGGGEVGTMRKRLSMTQRTLAMWIGVAPSTISSWERGRSNPSRLARRAIRQADRLLIGGEARHLLGKNDKSLLMF